MPRSLLLGIFTARGVGVMGSKEMPMDYSLTVLASLAAMPKIPAPGDSPQFKKYFMAV
jgi:hypothetical protein